MAAKASPFPFLSKKEPSLPSLDIRIPHYPQTSTDIKPPRREDLRPSYAQTLAGEDDQDNHGWYGNMINSLGSCIGTIGAGRYYVYTVPVHDLVGNIVPLSQSSRIQSHVPEIIEDEKSQVQGLGMEAACALYQKALKRSFQNTMNARLAEASQSLLGVSDWLLGHVGDLSSHPPGDPRATYTTSEIVKIRDPTEEDVGDNIKKCAHNHSPQIALGKAIRLLGSFLPARVIALLPIVFVGVNAEGATDLSLINPSNPQPSAKVNSTDLSSERGASFHKSPRELWDNLYNNWVELLKTFADQDAMEWSKCLALLLALVLTYWICKKLLCRQNSQTFGWTMLTFVVAVAIVYFENDSNLSAPMQFIVWLFSISLSLTYIQPDVALRKLNGIHTLFIASMALLLATAISWISQMIGFGGPISLGAAFALGLPTSSFTWRAVVYQTAWGDRIDGYILAADVMDVLAYAGSHLPGWITWIAQLMQGSGDQAAEPVPLDDVLVDGVDVEAPPGGNGAGAGGAEMNGEADVGDEPLGDHVANGGDEVLNN